MFGLLEILLAALLDVIILEDLSLATKEKNFDATQLSLAVKMSASTSPRNRSDLFSFSCPDEPIWP